MIDEVDGRVADWIGTVAGPVDVTFAAPGAAPAASGVNAYLFDVRFRPPPAGGASTRRQLLLRYLITTWDEQVGRAHARLGELLFAAVASSELEVERTAVPLELWRALGVVPRPAFVLRVPVSREVERPRPARVRQAVVLDSTPMRPLAGQVIGHGGVPVAGAAVEAVGLNLVTRTDPAGRFRFAAVPATPGGPRLRVRARGRVISIDPTEGGDAPQPLVIHLNSLEV